MQDFPLACDLSVLTPEQRRRHDELAAHLFGDSSRVQEMADGYAIAVPMPAFKDAAEFVTLERLCCPFLTFSLQVEPALDIAWLQMGGSADIKDLLALELNLA